MLNALKSDNHNTRYLANLMTTGPLARWNIEFFAATRGTSDSQRFQLFSKKLAEAKTHGLMGHSIVLEEIELIKLYEFCRDTYDKPADES